MELQPLLFWIVGIVLGLLLLYFVIKTAIVNGIRDSGLLEREHEIYVERNILENKPNAAQVLLKEKYEKGELTFEIYKSEWNKLKG
jgi:uncharacterized membrane protein